jgi:pSer/pThr/pTyr-binding forkhead associated (FHA) protein
MAQIRCWMCAQSSVVDLAPPDLNSSTIELSSVGEFERTLGASQPERASHSRVATLDLPEHKSVLISVVDGPSQGFERGMTVPLVTIGRLRGGADIEIDDPRVSRLHCAIEVKNDSVLLRDLRSTNGTYVGEKRVHAALLNDSAEFRIGETKIRVAVSPQ